MKRAVTAAALLGCAAGIAVLSACGGESTTGEPVAAAQEESATDDPPTSESEESDYSAADLCGLLESEEAVAMGGAPEGETAYSTTNGAELCRWDDAMGLAVGLQPGGSTKGIQNGPDQVVSPADVGGVPAVRKVTPSINTCEILIDLPNNNLFGVSVTPLSAGEGKYDPCTVADEFASITVPRVTDD